MRGVALQGRTCGLGSVSVSRQRLFNRACQPNRTVTAERRSLVTRATYTASPVSINVKNFQGEDSGSQDLALRVADDDTARGLVHRYLVTVRQNGRAGTASTKTRAEVRGGGQKPYNQKGTGNARQGSIRSPLKRGGGVVFGPKPKDWSISMNKKERRLAMGTAIQSATSNIIIVEDLQDSIDYIKTKALVQALERWGVGQEEYGLLITNVHLPKVAMSARNVDKLKVNTANALNVYDVLRADKIVMEKSAFEYIQGFYGDSQQRPSAAPKAEKKLKGRPSKGKLPAGSTKPSKGKKFSKGKRFSKGKKTSASKRPTLKSSQG